MLGGNQLYLLEKSGRSLEDRSPCCGSPDAPKSHPHPTTAMLLAKFESLAAVGELRSSMRFTIFLCATPIRWYRYMVCLLAQPSLL
ncbi:hypothetical protein GDO78_007196 [Eleutherodactylus coqui]|uniref:Uncharacterized protein n=1 Tax=Eleutherodactylus coqui TaxID=57060 RepID=A0A8J6FIC2_ELECQ|nr:hypothetical protein GDO78_007196 [Eleutherodactylus coqui]